MIHILWATIRPEMFKKSHSEWINRSENNDNIKTYVVVDHQDHYNDIKEYLKADDYIIKIDNNSIGVCYPSYQLSYRLGSELGTCENDDIVIFASDDFLPPNKWDTYLINKLKNKGDKVLIVNDGYQKNDFSNMIYPAVTLPIMTYGALLKLNKIIYNPIYSHMFSDCELYINAKDLELIYDDRKNDMTLFEHLHHSPGKRKKDSYDEIYYNNWNDDQRKWNERNKMSLEERLKIKNI